MAWNKSKYPDPVPRPDSQLTLGEPAGSDGRMRLWNCKCACGNTVALNRNQLRTNRSCGCRLRARQAIGNVIHGKKHTRTYLSWLAMKSRIFNPKNIGFANYGGRGIRIDPAWSQFENFYADMGDRPPGMTLDRLDVDGDYCKSNCCWSTRLTQSRNRRSNTYITYRGETHCLSEWCELLKLPYARTRDRINVFGMTFEDAISKPLRNTRTGPMATQKIRSASTLSIVG
jgi:hypothetical protein